MIRQVETNTEMKLLSTSSRSELLPVSHMRQHCENAAFSRVLSVWNSHIATNTHVSIHVIKMLQYYAGNSHHYPSTRFTRNCFYQLQCDAEERAEKECKRKRIYHVAQVHLRALISTKGERNSPEESRVCPHPLCRRNKYFSCLPNKRVNDVAKTARKPRTARRPRRSASAKVETSNEGG